ncbi:hypothetical protein TNCV_1045941 [Trichonephila clavipes]|nr:hypothetical protein TNCV_1045941 [Trichonephila clavipes]
MCSNLGKFTDICKCVVPLQHEGTLNSRRTASPLVRLVQGEARWEFLDPQGVLPLNWIGTEKKIILPPVWCSRLRPTKRVHLEVQLVSESGIFRSGRTRQ